MALGCPHTANSLASRLCKRLLQLCCQGLMLGCVVSTRGRGLPEQTYSTDIIGIQTLARSGQGVILSALTPAYNMPVLKMAHRCWNHQDSHNSNDWIMGRCFDTTLQAVRHVALPLQPPRRDNGWKVQLKAKYWEILLPWLWVQSPWNSAGIHLKDYVYANKGHGMCQENSFSWSWFVVSPVPLNSKWNTHNVELYNPSQIARFQEFVPRTRNSKCGGFHTQFTHILGAQRKARPVAIHVF